MELRNVMKCHLIIDPQEAIPPGGLVMGEPAKLGPHVLRMITTGQLVATNPKEAAVEISAAYKNHEWGKSPDARAVMAALRASIPEETK